MNSSSQHQAKRRQINLERKDGLMDKHNKSGDRYLERRDRLAEAIGRP